jgi:hypothetical protein
MRNKQRCLLPRKVLYQRRCANHFAANNASQNRAFVDEKKETKHTTHLTSCQKSRRCWIVRTFHCHLLHIQALQAYSRGLKQNSAIDMAHHTTFLKYQRYIIPNTICHNITFCFLPFFFLYLFSFFKMNKNVSHAYTFFGVLGTILCCFMYNSTCSGI